LHDVFLLSDSGGLEGSIPTEIGHLQKLLLLDLGMLNNYIFVIIKLLSYTKETFCTGNNDFDGSIPDEFYNMNKLKAVYLRE